MNRERSRHPSEGVANLGPERSGPLSSRPETNWRGLAINDDLLRRGFLPLFDSLPGTIKLYRLSRTPPLTGPEFAAIWLERNSLGEYLQGVA